MHDAPSPTQIAEAAARFLRERAAGVSSAGVPDEAAAYLERVVANLLTIAARERAQRPIVAEEEQARLRALLGWPHDHAGTLADLNRALAERIAAGTLGLHTPGLAAHLWQVTLAKLAVDQPSYSTYRATHRTGDVGG
jgi:hypothetical protein